MSGDRAAAKNLFSRMVNILNKNSIIKSFCHFLVSKVPEAKSTTGGFDTFGVSLRCGEIKLWWRGACRIEWGEVEIRPLLQARVPVSRQPLANTNTMSQDE